MITGLSAVTNTFPFQRALPGHSLKVHEHSGQMPRCISNGENRDRMRVDLNARWHDGREHLRNGAVEFLDDVEFFDMTFTQLRIAHDLGDDLIGARDLLLNDSDLLRDFSSGVPQGALQRKGGAVDDGQRILDLMRKLCASLPGTQLSFPRANLRFLGCPAADVPNSAWVP